MPLWRQTGDGPAARSSRAIATISATAAYEEAAFARITSGELRLGRRTDQEEREAVASLRSLRSVRATADSTRAEAPSASSSTALSRQAPGADSHGSTPKPPASDPAIAPAVFAAYARPISRPRC